MRTLHLGARAFIPVALAAAVLFSVAPSTPAAATSATEAQQIVRIARAQLGDRWHYGATGPRSFDCSGLVVYAFRKAGDARAIHTGFLRSARSIYHWFKAHGKAISTLRNGVHIHGVHAVSARFTAYLHTGMSTKPAR